MLGNIEAKSHLEPKTNPNPHITAEEKRALVTNYLAAGATFQRRVVARGHMNDYELVAAPLDITLHFTLAPDHHYRPEHRLGEGGESPALPTDLHIKELDLKDPDIYKSGFGTELLRQAVALGSEECPSLCRSESSAEKGGEDSDLRSSARPSYPRLTTVSASSANLGLFNTIAGVAGGLEGLSARMGGYEYGAGTMAPIEQIVRDLPYQAGIRYLLQDVLAAITPTRLAELEHDPRPKLVA